MSGFATAVSLGNVNGRFAPFDGLPILGDPPGRGVVNGHEVTALDGDFHFLGRNIPRPAIVEAERADRAIGEVQGNPAGTQGPVLVLCFRNDVGCFFRLGPRDPQLIVSAGLNRFERGQFHAAHTGQDQPFQLQSPFEDD